jgi:hypothetical protein
MTEGVFSYYLTDRIALLEVWSVLAHDYGLYALNARLDRMGFRPSPSLTYDTLDLGQKEYYALRSYDANVTPSYSPKIVRCK